MTASSRMPMREVTFVTAEGCGHCVHGRRVLAELSERRPLAVHEVALDTPEGRALLARYRFPFPPAVIVDGELAGYGRLSPRRLQRVLDRHPAGEGR